MGAFVAIEEGNFAFVGTAAMAEAAYHEEHEGTRSMGNHGMHEAA